MENIRLDGHNYQIIKNLESDNWLYYYTLDNSNDNEVVILCKDPVTGEITKVEEREYPILMNKFALK